MSLKAITIGAAALLWAAPAQAQERGTVEIGAFASVAKFNEDLSLTNAFGGGGRVGVFLDPRWSVEFEMGEMRATRPNGLKDVNVGILSARLMAVPIKAGALSILLGAGAGVGTETNFLHSYGLTALLGAKIRTSEHSALRMAVQNDWLANYDFKAYQRASLGLSFYRDFFIRTRTETVTVPGPSAPCAACVQRADSVSAAETRRLRDRDAALRALRDSLSRNPPFVRSESSTEARSTMEEHIHFEFDRSDIILLAREILDEKVPVFRANPTMTIMIIGHAGNMGTENYNQALGQRRAESTKAYLVAQGIDANRISTDSKGETEPVVPAAAGKAANAPNRRAMFTLIVVPDVIKKP